MEIKQNGCVALFLYGFGAFILVQAGTAQDELLHVPRWVMFGLGLGILAGGLAATFPNQGTVSRGLGLLFLIGFFVPFHWLLFAKPNLLLLIVLASFYFIVIRHLVVKGRNNSDSPGKS